MESVLKEFYDSLRKDALPLHGSTTLPLHDSSSQSTLVPSSLRRTPSMVSKAPSEHPSFRSAGARGLGSNLSSNASRFGGSRKRSRPKLLQTSTASSRSSMDDHGSSLYSPVASSTWSKHSGHPSAANTMSLDSLGSAYTSSTPVDYQKSIGFASALNQAIIREEHQHDAASAGSGGQGYIEPEEEELPTLEDETLQLAGAPWAKEGIVKHKHHFEAIDKKAKNRDWNECFAVVEHGRLSLFSFSGGSSVMPFGRSMHRSKSKKQGRGSGTVVGGGNWLSKATPLMSVSLRQTLASSLPPPGYSRSRPYVFALTLPNGAVHLFQGGTSEIVTEFVDTSNYWAARLSKEPLVGGVSNIEYGWSDSILNAVMTKDENLPFGTTLKKSNSTLSISSRRPSTQSSLREYGDAYGGSFRPRHLGDRITISEWTPPQQSMMASNLREEDQEVKLREYVQNVEEELANHNKCRSLIPLAFGSRSANAAKALGNWERKSSYLLREIVKFTTYVGSLAAAIVAKEEIDRERRERAATALD